MSDEQVISEEPFIPRFKDRRGTEWVVILNHGMIEDINEHTSTQIDQLLKKPEEFVRLLFLDPKRIVEMLYFICEEQIKERKLEPRDFGRLLDRDAIDNAVNAFLAALVIFYQRASAGKALAERLPAILSKMDRDITAYIHRATLTELLPTTTDSRESSAGLTGTGSVHSPPES